MVVALDATLGLPGGVLDGRLLDRPASSPSATTVVAPALAPEPAEVVLPPANGETVPTPAGLGDVLEPLLGTSALGPKVGVSVVDLATGSQLYGARADASRTPASTTKLLTAAATLSLLGPEARLRTRVVEGSPTASGDKPPQIVLVGAGDPSLRMSGGRRRPVATVARARRRRCP